MPNIFASSPKTENDAQGLTRFGIVVGEETAWKPGTPARFADVADGTRGTVAFVERREPVCWMAPDRELTFERLQTEGTSVLKKMGGYCVVGTLDGSVRVFPQTIEPQDLEAIFTSNGGEPLLPSWSPARQ